VVIEVKFTFDGLGQFTKDEQDPSGVVNGSTLAVQYAPAAKGPTFLVGSTWILVLGPPVSRVVETQRNSLHGRAL
jgi:hypothetical protein